MLLWRREKYIHPAAERVQRLVLGIISDGVMGLFRLVFWGSIGIYFYIVTWDYMLFSRTNSTTYYILCYGVSPLLIVISVNMWV